VETPGAQVKMRELGVTTHSDYKVTLLMDHKCMVTVRTDKYGACM
jgi:ubiquitin-like domain-containing CTD phosphatase 1